LLYEKVAYSLFLVEKKILEFGCVRFECGILVMYDDEDWGGKRSLVVGTWMGGEMGGGIENSDN
jgi:hypothetical protein